MWFIQISGLQRPLGPLADSSDPAPRLALIPMWQHRIPASPLPACRPPPLRQSPPPLPPLHLLRLQPPPKRLWKRDEHHRAGEMAGLLFYFTRNKPGRARGRCTSCSRLWCRCSRADRSWRVSNLHLFPGSAGGWTPTGLTPTEEKSLCPTVKQPEVVQVHTFVTQVLIQRLYSSTCIKVQVMKCTQSITVKKFSSGCICAKQTETHVTLM